MNWELPDGWRWTPLRDQLDRGRLQIAPSQMKDEWLYLGLEHLESGTGEYSGARVCDAGIRSNKYVFNTGDVLYGKLRPNLRKCVVADVQGVCSTDLVPMRPFNAGAAHFIALQLRSPEFTAEVMRLIGGANLPRINMADFFRLSLPTPPPEQEARLHALARSAAAMRARQRELSQSVKELERAASCEVLGMR